MKLSKKERLLIKALKHEQIAIDLYEEIEEIERQESMIGFKTKNDNRVSSDKHQISISQLYNERDDYEYRRGKRRSK